LAGHGPLNALYDGRADAAVVFELLSAVVDADAGLSADELVVGAFIRVLEPPPAADVIDQDGREFGLSAAHVCDQLLQRLSAVQRQSALAGILVRSHDIEATPRRVLGDR